MFVTINEEVTPVMTVLIYNFIDWTNYISHLVSVLYFSCLTIHPVD